MQKRKRKNLFKNIILLFKKENEDDPGNYTPASTGYINTGQDLWADYQAACYY